MTAETILYIIIAGVIALILAIFMYGYRTKYTVSLRWTFGILRFITLFSILLLLINPKLRSETYHVVKPKLPVLIDNSASVKELNQSGNVSDLLKRLKEDDDLNEKFELSYFTFGSGFNSGDSLSFTEGNTNISEAFTATDRLFGEEIAPTIFISDGNQTLGTDYEFSTLNFRNPIFPVILGDSIKHTDLRIEHLNTNRYAFLKNRFPVEVMLVYNGSGPASTTFVISQGALNFYSENITFSETENTKTLSFTLPASSVGIQKYTAHLTPLNEEKNRINNTKQFAVEVIDQATNVLVVSQIVHPDLGALKKAITSNEQRAITFKKPSEAVSLLNDHQLVVLYQPDRDFASVYSEIEKLKKNTLVITGMKTDWNFLNSAQQLYVKEATGQEENISGVRNPNYSTFSVDAIGFDEFPPLRTAFGDLVVSVPHDILLEQSINGFSTENPMLATMETDRVRSAIWDGEGIWTWRAQSYLNSGSFEDFDNFIGKLVQYLSSNERRSRLEVSNESFYYNNNPIRISAQYFDNNFIFDPRASLTITVIHEETKKRQVFPMLLKNNYYEVDLSSLLAGEYRYTVAVADETVSRSGNFTILDFNVEQQFLNANVSKLNTIASQTKGAGYFINEAGLLFEALLEDNRFHSLQKSEQKVVPLIDWKYLLILIVLSLSSEWFIRKYNGLT